MKQKLFMMLAALMLMGTSAMAQSETLKGDVNADGVVDVADIAAVIKIMTDNGDIEKTYYWYVGQTNPASIDTSNLKTATNEAGWHLIGTSIDGFTLTINSKNRIEFDEEKQYYLIIPEGLTLYASDGVTIHATLLEMKSNIPNHKTYISKGETYAAQGFIVK